jgi:hypothetical protein
MLSDDIVILDNIVVCEQTPTGCDAERALALHSAICSQLDDVPAVFSVSEAKYFILEALAATDIFYIIHADDVALLLPPSNIHIPTSPIKATLQSR